MCSNYPKTTNKSTKIETCRSYNKLCIQKYDFNISATERLTLILRKNLAKSIKTYAASVLTYSFGVNN
jgi:hypothetical protein